MNKTIGEYLLSKGCNQIVYIAQANRLGHAPWNNTGISLDPTNGFFGSLIGERESFLDARGSNLARLESNPFNLVDNLNYNETQEDWNNLEYVASPNNPDVLAWDEFILPLLPVGNAQALADAIKAADKAGRLAQADKWNWWKDHQFAPESMSGVAPDQHELRLGYRYAVRGKTKNGQDISFTKFSDSQGDETLGVGWVELNEYRALIRVSTFGHFNAVAIGISCDFVLYDRLIELTSHYSVIGSPLEN